MKSADSPHGIVVIGASWGGVIAIRKILGCLSKDFPLPIAIVQHRLKSSENILARILGASCLMPLREPDDKEPLQNGHVYLAPGGYHMLLENAHISLSVDDPVHYSRPSIDVLFESAADAYQDRSIGVLLTGANRDGASGLRRIEDMGGRIIIQDPATAESPCMPTAGIEQTLQPFIVALDQIGPFLAAVGRDFLPRS